MTSTVPAPSFGSTATICLAVSLTILVAATLPNITTVALPRLVPVIVTWMPPAVRPAEGLTPVTAGGAAVMLKAFEVAEARLPSLAARM